MTTGFSQVLASIDRAAGTAAVTVPPDWLQGRTVFGGMQMALATRAMRTALPLPAAALPLRSAQMTFVGPLLGGQPIYMSAESVRTGKTTVHARCDLRHEDGKLASTVVAIEAASSLEATAQFVIPPVANDEVPRIATEVP